MAINATDSPNRTQQTKQAEAPAPKADAAAKPDTCQKPAETAEAKPDVAKDVVDATRKAVKSAEDAIKAKLGGLLGDDGVSGRQFAAGTGKKGTRGGIRTVMNNTGPTSSNSGNIA